MRVERGVQDREVQSLSHQEEHFITEFGTALAELFRKNPEKYEKELWIFFEKLAEGDCTPQEVIARIKEVSKEWGITK